MTVRGDDRSVFSRQAQTTWCQLEETMSPAWRALENDVDRYRQIESEPNRQNLGEMVINR